MRSGRISTAPTSIAGQRHAHFRASSKSVIICETLGSIGLLIPRTLLPAAIGLSILMLGAIRTHVHNGDPFADSLEALHLLILLVSIIVIRLYQSKVVVSENSAQATAAN
jgi:uncharacterized membrane protein YphA (DoxX/SURF4 family)